MILLKLQQTDGGGNMKAEIKCDCPEATYTTNVVEAVKAIYNPCDVCDSKQTVKLVEAPSKGKK